MANALYDFPYCTVTVEYPESSLRVQFGNSWTFVAPPTAPDQRIFTLKYPTMYYYVDSGGAIDYTKNPKMNFGVLEQFYQTHRLYKKFDYVHPVYGLIVVRFHQPLIVPEGMPGGTGALQSFEVKLVEQP